MPKRILVIPEFNEAKTILGVLDRAYPHVDLLIVVNDGSTDASGQLVQEWALDRTGVVLLTLKQNQGKSGALLAGFTYVVHLLNQGFLAPDDVVIGIDADGQHLPEEIPLALAAMRATGSDVLLARRDLRGYPRYKHVGNWGLSLWASLLSGYRYSDVECGFRLMRVAVVADFLPFFTGRRYSCDQEIGIITARRGWKINNCFTIDSNYYRHGTRIRDGLTNMWMGGIAFLRVVLGRPHSLPERMQTVLGLVAEPLSAPVTLTPWAV